MLNVSEVLTILEKEGLTSSRQVVLRWSVKGDLPAVQEYQKKRLSGWRNQTSMNLSQGKRKPLQAPNPTEQTTDDYQAGYQAAIKDLLEKAMVSGVRRPFSFSGKMPVSRSI